MVTLAPSFFDNPFRSTLLSYHLQAVASKLHGVEVEIDIVKRKGEPIDEAEKVRALAREQLELDRDTTVVGLDACPGSQGTASASASVSASSSIPTPASVNAEQNNNHNASNNTGIGNNNINNNNNDGQQIASELGKHQLRQTNCFRLITFTDTLLAHEYNNFSSQHVTLIYKYDS